MGSHWRHGGSLSKDVSVLGWLFSSRFVGQDIHATQSSHLEILSRRKSTNNNIVTTAKRPNPAIWPKMLGHMGLRGRFFTRSSLTFCWTWTEEKKKWAHHIPFKGILGVCCAPSAEANKRPEASFENESRGRDRTWGGFLWVRNGMPFGRKDGIQFLPWWKEVWNTLPFWLLTDKCVYKSKEFNWKKQDLDQLPPAAISLIERRKWISQGKPFHNS